MRAGCLKNRISIEKLTKNNNDFGEVIENYELFKEAYCEVTGVQTVEKYFKNKYVDVDVKKFRIRFLKDIKTDMRILYENQFYNIKEIVDPYNNKRELLIVGELIDV